MVDINNHLKFLELNKDTKLTVAVTGVGEFILHPHFDKIIKSIPQQGHRLHSIATTLNAPHFDRLLDALALFDKAFIEVGGAPGNKEKNMGFSSDTFEKNLDAYMSYLQDNKGSTQVMLKMIMNKNSIGDIPYLKELRNKYSYPHIQIAPAEVEIYPKDDYDNFVNPICTKSYSPESMIALNHDTFFKYRAARDAQYDKKCDLTKADPNRYAYSLDTDGSLYLCSKVQILADTKLAVGNAFEMPILEIEQTNKFKEVLEAMADQTYTAHCKHCVY
jgi:radical SAM protein with 4Fe4S-binding SPASM domain